MRQCEFAVYLPVQGMDDIPLRVTIELPVEASGLLPHFNRVCRSVLVSCLETFEGPLMTETVDGLKLRAEQEGIDSPNEWHGFELPQ